MLDAKIKISRVKVSDRASQEKQQHQVAAESGIHRVFTIFQRAHTVLPRFSPLSVRFDREHLDC